ncbi:hypothetical protein D5086_023824 [Populus alba]|uniref:Uncharacterized protein n=1 Tax=Populus alba TaxID=43335 RepID=A0ACC4BAX8_POPAL
MEVACAVDSHFVGDDIGTVPLQSKETGVAVDFADPSIVYDKQAAIAASFHYNNAEIVESRSNPIARGQVLGEDGDRVYSMVLPGLPYSAAIYFSGPGVVYSIKHDISDLKCLKPGLILAIRKVIRLKLFASAHIKVRPLIYVFVIMEESSVWLGETLVSSQHLSLASAPSFGIAYRVDKETCHHVGNMHIPPCYRQ